MTVVPPSFFQRFLAGGPLLLVLVLFFVLFLNQAEGLELVSRRSRRAPRSSEPRTASSSSKATSETRLGFLQKGREEFLPACTCACCAAFQLPTDANKEHFEKAGRLKCGPQTKVSGLQCVDVCKADDSILCFAKDAQVDYSLYCYYECQSPCGATAGVTSCEVLPPDKVAEAKTIGCNGQPVLPDAC